MKRITIAQLNAVVARLNRITNSPTEYTSGNGKSNVGHFCIGQAYGGYTLERISNEDGGITKPLNTGYIKARELYDQMHAFISGIEFAAANFTTIR